MITLVLFGVLHRGQGDVKTGIKANQFVWGGGGHLGVLNGRERVVYKGVNVQSLNPPNFAAWKELFQ